MIRHHLRLNVEQMLQQTENSMAGFSIPLE